LAVVIDINNWRSNIHNVRPLKILQQADQQSVNLIPPDMLF